MNKLEAPWTAGWILLNVSLVICAMFPWATGTLPYWLLLSFALFEAAAILRKGTGDTLSEHIWTFYSGRWSRRWLIYGYSALLTSLILFASTGAGWIYQAGMLAFGLCFGAWMVDHFIKLGRDG